jgi:hypothetical protein
MTPLSSGCGWPPPDPPEENSIKTRKEIQPDTFPMIKIPLISVVEVHRQTRVDSRLGSRAGTVFYFYN